MNRPITILRERKLGCRRVQVIHGPQHLTYRVLHHDEIQDNEDCPPVVQAIGERMVGVVHEELASVA